MSAAASIRKPKSPVSCRWWGGNRKQGISAPIRVATCGHPRLWRRYLGKTCSEICAAGACPFGRELEAGDDDKI